MPDDFGLHQCMLAYASDLTLMVAAVYPHRASMRSPGSTGPSASTTGRSSSPASKSSA